MQEAWLKLDELHQQNQPYNLIYSKNCLHLIPRIPQGSGNLPPRFSGYGWSEMAGAINLFSLESFESLSERTTDAELAGFSP
jgi:hypothetical protein